MKLTHIKITFRILFLLLLVFGCENKIETEKKLLLSELTEMEIRRNPLTSKINALRSEYAILRDEYTRLENDMARYKRDINRYMLNHKMATAAVVGGLGGLKVAMDDSNTFSQEAKNIGGGLALLAALYAWDNPDEVFEVADQLNQADVAMKEASEYKEKLVVQIIDVEGVINNKQKIIDSLNNAIETKRNKIRELEAID